MKYLRLGLYFIVKTPLVMLAVVMWMLACGGELLLEGLYTLDQWVEQRLG
jgi:hypothetical protein